jgi:hypothetical protein
MKRSSRLLNFTCAKTVDRRLAFSIELGAVLCGEHPSHQR